jgi:sortase (surface protein transpeptidase)
MRSALGCEPDRAPEMVGEEGLPSSPIDVPSPRAGRILIIVSAVALAGVLLVLLAGPSSERRSDLVPAAAAPAGTASTWTTAPTATTAPTPPVPARLRIPLIGVDVPVVPVGLEPDGSMGIPGATEVGWYQPGVRPGSPQGSAVLAAHVDYAGRRGAFFDLRRLPEGAEVFVVVPDGRELRFLVAERAQVDKQDLPVDELFRSDGPATLTLITCGGSFDRSARHYEDNIVVRADPSPLQ